MREVNQPTWDSILAAVSALSCSVSRVTAAVSCCFSISHMLGGFSDCWNGFPASDISRMVPRGSPMESVGESWVGSVNGFSTVWP